MKKIYLLFFITLLFLFPKTSYSENKCTTDILHQKPLKNDSAYSRRRQELESWIYLNALKKNESESNDKALRTTPSYYTTPVVVHIIHNGGPENISDAMQCNALH